MKRGSRLSPEPAKEGIQAAMGWENIHLHVFVKDWIAYGEGGRSESDVTLERLLPVAGARLAYRYDLGDHWDHDIEMEKIHRPAKGVAYPRCSAGGRACPPEDSGGPEGFAEHPRALRHRKGWKYQQARRVLGASRWDGAAWDKDAVNAELADLAVHLARQAEARKVEEAELTERLAQFNARRGENRTELYGEPVDVGSPPGEQPPLPIGQADDVPGGEELFGDSEACVEPSEAVPKSIVSGTVQQGLLGVCGFHR
ncbi:hypothetical protein HS048_35235 [Planomonospora sp. ID91781]|uniref:plasmid pRiA4b ORF-3 family protein n=1 Tax=Planomonospora sp. ID91781 TaxID=2738135 RepID=UPI0018C3AD98|nr:hypothetical protein [Planomonospora sp. ID91781]MBG0825930.1 hypothetical protein [Planomonospora sp. ID91781]